MSNCTSRAPLLVPHKMAAYVTSKDLRLAPYTHCGPRQLKIKITSVHFGCTSTWSSASLTVSQYVGQLGLYCQRWLLRPTYSLDRRLSIWIIPSYNSKQRVLLITTKSWYTLSMTWPNIKHLKQNAFKSSLELRCVTEQLASHS